MPGSSPKMLGKAAALSADEIVIDLEDAVALDAKSDARGATLAALDGWAGPTAAVRVNAPRTPWCHEDVVAMAGAARLASIVVPKVESAGDVAFVERLLDGAEAAAGRERPLRVQALIETAEGLLRLDEIASASSRLTSLILGYADLAASLGGDRRPADWLPAQHALVVAARANGLQAIDGPYLGTAPDEGFLEAARHAVRLGFDGKWAIHPSQLAALDDAFSPTDEEVAHARAVVDALARAEAEGHGAVALDGQMLDEALRAAALRTLARAGATA